MIDEAHQMRREAGQGDPPATPPRDDARAPSTSAAPFGIDADILRQAAALPGFARFAAPQPSRPSTPQPPAEPMPVEAPAPETPEPVLAEPVLPQPITDEATADEADAPSAPSERDWPRSLALADADVVAPRRLDLTSIDRSLQRIADVLERRLGEIAERPHRLRDLGVMPRVPVPPAPQDASSSPMPGAPMPAEPMPAAQPAAPPAEADEAKPQTAEPPPVPAEMAAPVAAAEPAAASRKPLGWGWAFLIGFAIFAALVAAGARGWLPDPAQKLTAPIADAASALLSRVR